MRQIEDWDLLKRERDAATRIQKNYRRYIARKKFMDLVYKTYVDEVTPRSLVIQKYWRKFAAIKTTKHHALVRSLKNSYGHNRDLITRHIKGTSVVHKMA